MLGTDKGGHREHFCELAHVSSAPTQQEVALHRLLRLFLRRDVRLGRPFNWGCTGCHAAWFVGVPQGTPACWSPLWFRDLLSARHLGGPAGTLDAYPCDMLPALTWDASRRDATTGNKGSY